MEMPGQGEGGGIEHEEPEFEEPKLPFLPTDNDIDGIYPPAETIAILADQFGPPEDDGAKPVDHPDKDQKPAAPLQPIDVFLETETPPDTTKEPQDVADQLKRDYAARNQLRLDGKTLLVMGDSSSGGVSLDTSQIMDRAAGVFRADLRDFWTYNKANMAAQIEALGDSSSRLDAFRAVFAGDQKLLDALKDWADGLTRTARDWPDMAAKIEAVAAQLLQLRKAVEEKYPSAHDFEAKMGIVLDALGHEVAREAAAYLTGGPMDLGDRSKSMAYALRLISPVHADADVLSQVLNPKGQNKGYKLSKYLESNFKKALDATRLAKGTVWIQPVGDKLTPWVADLMRAADAWAEASANWKPGSDGLEFVNATTDLLKGFDAANTAITAADPPVGARRITQRALNALTEAIANRIDELSANSVAIKARLGRTARLLQSFSGPQPLPDSPADYWDKAITAALALPGLDGKALSKTWFTQEIPSLLKGWSKQTGADPKDFDRAQFIQDTWTITLALSRCKQALTPTLMPNLQAREQVLDAMDVIAGEMAYRLDRV